MSISFSVLGSGSAGNSALLVLRGGAEDRVALIDCGLSPRRTGAALAAQGLERRHVRDVLVTHFDTDHFHAGWGAVLANHDLTVHAHRRHRREALRAGVPDRRLHLFDDAFDLDAATHVGSVLLAHDDEGTVGYVLEHGGARLGWATDLGHVPDAMYEAFVHLHALAIESNYDRHLQLTSDRPEFLKRRIMGGAGHLSNDQSLAAILRIARQSDLAHVALLHLSRQCNHPRIIQRLFSDRAPRLLRIVTVSSQHLPTSLLHVPGTDGSTSTPPVAGPQMTMFDGTVS